MAYNWPSSHKAGTTTTDGATDRIDQARADIQQNIVNVNEIIDMFDLASEPSNNQILKYNTTTDKFEVADASTGSSTVGKQDMWIPAQTMYPGHQTPCGNHASGPYGQTLRHLPFDSSSDEAAEFCVKMPKKWNEGTVTMTIYWTVLTADTGGVTWGITGQAIQNGMYANTAWAVSGSSFTTVDDTRLQQGGVHVAPESSAIDIVQQGPTEQNELQFFRITRDVSDSNDTMAADACLLGVMLHYTSDAENDA